MSIESGLVTALSAIAGGQIYQDTIPQSVRAKAGRILRFSVISIEPAADLCGDDAEETGDRRVQLDVIADSAQDRADFRAQVLQAMTSFDPPAIFDGEQRSYESDVKKYVSTIDYLFYPSSDEDSP